MPPAEILEACRAAALELPDLSWLRTISEVSTVQKQQVLLDLLE